MEVVEVLLQIFVPFKSHPSSCALEGLVMVQLVHSFVSLNSFDNFWVSYFSVRVQPSCSIKGPCHSKLSVLILEADLHEIEHPLVLQFVFSSIPIWKVSLFRWTERRSRKVREISRNNPLSFTFGQ